MTDAVTAPVDAAWVVIDTPLEAGRLAEFCADIERLYRINPYLEFRYWRSGDAGKHEAAFRNLSNHRDFELALAVESAASREFAVRYGRGVKRSTHFRIEPRGSGSRLTITDEYDASTPDADLKEVDKSLHAWGSALQDYLRRHARWGHRSWWRWYMRRVWIPMRPSARRIVYILWVLTVFEVALIALGIGIYWIEYR